MPVTRGTTGPYTSPSAVLSVIEKHRNKGLPSPIDADTLARAGVSESLIPRTLQALVALDLLNEEYAPTETLEGLRLAPEAEYKERMADWLRHAYADALSFIEPDSDETAIRDAFRSYKPTGQQTRMVTLFTGLFTAAGLREPSARKPPPASSAPRRPRTEKPSSSTNSSKSSRQGAPAGAGQIPPPAGLPPAISGLLQSLPAAGRGWTREKRDQFVATFGAVLDFCFPIVSGKSDNEKTEREDMEE